MTEDLQLLWPIMKAKIKTDFKCFYLLQRAPWPALTTCNVTETPYQIEWRHDGTKSPYEIEQITYKTFNGAIKKFQLWTALNNSGKDSFCWRWRGETFIWPNFPSVINSSSLRHGQKSHVWCLLLISPCAELQSEVPQRSKLGIQTLLPQPVQRQIGLSVLYVKLPARKHGPAGYSAQLLCCSQTVMGSHCLSCFAFWEHKRWEGH